MWARATEGNLRVSMSDKKDNERELASSSLLACRVPDMQKRAWHNKTGFRLRRTSIKPITQTLEPVLDAGEAVLDAPQCFRIPGLAPRRR